jgi:hypothetical protein
MQQAQERINNTVNVIGMMHSIPIYWMLDDLQIKWLSSAVADHIDLTLTEMHRYTVDVSVFH